MSTAGVFEEIRLSSLPDELYVKLNATRLQKSNVVSMPIIDFDQLNLRGVARKDRGVSTSILPTLVYCPGVPL
jgi:hypothetical protein